MGTNDGDVRVLWSLGHERSPHLHSFFALHGSSISLFLSFLLYIIVRTVSIGFPEFSRQFDVILSMEVGPWKFPLSVTWSEVRVSRTTWLASDVRRVLVPQPVAWALSNPVFLPRKFHRQRSLAGTVRGVGKSWTQLSRAWADRAVDQILREGSLSW